MCIYKWVENLYLFKYWENWGNWRQVGFWVLNGLLFVGFFFITKSMLLWVFSIRSLWFVTEKTKENDREVGCLGLMASLAGWFVLTAYMCTYLLLQWKGKDGESFLWFLSFLFIIEKRSSSGSYFLITSGSFWEWKRIEVEFWV